MHPERLMTVPCEITYVAELGDVDEYGNPTEVETTEELIDPGCWFEQTARTENTVDANQQLTTWRAYFPATLTLDGIDRVAILGDDYEFVGPPWRAFNPRLRRVTHVEATLRRSSGGPAGDS